MPLIELAVLVPLNFAIAVRDLDKPYAGFQETPRHQALPTKIFGDRIIDAIQPFCSRRFAVKSCTSGMDACMR